jgi:hypothetical protein
MGKADVNMKYSFVSVNTCKNDVRWTCEDSKASGCGLANHHPQTIEGFELRAIGLLLHKPISWSQVSVLLGR